MDARWHVSSGHPPQPCIRKDFSLDNIVDGEAAILAQHLVGEVLAGRDHLAADVPVR
jgi:hypothetical protein